MNQNQLDMLEQADKLFSEIDTEYLLKFYEEEEKIGVAYWRDINDCLPEEGESVYTVGYTIYGWTRVIPAVYTKGKFIMALSFNSERVVEIAIETKPTHWCYKIAQMPQVDRDWKLSNVKD